MILRLEQRKDFFLDLSSSTRIRTWNTRLEDGSDRPFHHRAITPEKVVSLPAARQVDRRGVEPRLSECKSDVFPLDEQPSKTNDLCHVISGGSGGRTRQSKLMRLR